MAEALLISTLVPCPFRQPVFVSWAKKKDAQQILNKRNTHKTHYIKMSEYFYYNVVFPCSFSYLFILKLNELWLCTNMYTVYTQTQTHQKTKNAVNCQLRCCCCLQKKDVNDRCSREREKEKRNCIFQIASASVSARTRSIYSLNYK